MHWIRSAELCNFCFSVRVCFATFAFLSNRYDTNICDFMTYAATVVAVVRGKPSLGFALAVNVCARASDKMYIYYLVSNVARTGGTCVFFFLWFPYLYSPLVWPYRVRREFSHTKISIFKLTRKTNRKKKRKKKYLSRFNLEMRRFVVTGCFGVQSRHVTVHKTIKQSFVLAYSRTVNAFAYANV